MQVPETTLLVCVIVSVSSGQLCLRNHVGALYVYRASVLVNSAQSVLLHSDDGLTQHDAVTVPQLTWIFLPSGVPVSNCLSCCH